jgi:6-phosphogluconolactonase
MIRQVIVGDVEALAEALVDQMTEMESAHAGRRLSMALPGGSTAETLLPRLAQARLDWSRFDFFWGDERAVAPDHPDSNYGLSQRLFLEPIAADPARVHRLKAEGPDLDAAARDYEADLGSVIGEPPRLDFVLMGMGPDGHVCSLFPGHPALQEKSRHVLAIFDSPKPPPRRVTLSLLALEAARVVCVAAFGESKAGALQAGLLDPGSTLPVARVARRQGRTLFLLDAAAGSKLPRDRGESTLRKWPAGRP